MFLLPSFSAVVSVTNWRKLFTVVASSRLVPGYFPYPANARSKVSPQIVYFGSTVFVVTSLQLSRTLDGGNTDGPSVYSSLEQLDSASLAASLLLAGSA